MSVFFRTLDSSFLERSEIYFWLTLPGIFFCELPQHFRLWQIPHAVYSSTQRVKLFPRVHECISRVLEKMLFAYPLINKREQLSSYRAAVFTLGYFNDPNYIVIDQTTWHWLKIHIIIFFYHYILICSLADRLINNYLQGAQQLASLSLTSFKYHNHNTFSRFFLLA